MNGEGKKLKGEYSARGEYHKYLDPSWSYYPIYVRKLKFVRNYIENLGRGNKILDVGCGEGVLVEEYQKQGYDISGIDLNYSSNFVLKGNVKRMPFENETFRCVLCLDMIEHLKIGEQEKALEEIFRVMAKDGQAIISIPNLAHLNSRLKFLTHGEFVRTANIGKHPGDRPIKEYLKLITGTGFKIKKRFGIKLTLPKSIDKTAKTILPKGLYEKVVYDFKYPANLCFLNIVIVEKND